MVPHSSEENVPDRRHLNSLAWIGAPQDRRELEGETKHPSTGQKLRDYNIRSFDRVAQVQRSRNEVELDEADGTTRVIHCSEFLVRWT
jgi:hypothetical protein